MLMRQGSVLHCAIDIKWACEETVLRVRGKRAREKFPIGSVRTAEKWNRLRGPVPLLRRLEIYAILIETFCGA